MLLHAAVLLYVAAALVPTLLLVLLLSLGGVAYGDMSCHMHQVQDSRYICSVTSSQSNIVGAPR